MRGVQRERVDYTRQVVLTRPTYYWSMQDATVIDRPWPPFAGNRTLIPLSVSTGLVAAYPGPFGSEIAHAGAVPTTDAFRAVESTTGTVAGAGTINANRNTTGYSYMIWARNLDTALSDRAYFGNWQTNGTLLYVHTGTDMRVYHNSAFSTLTGLKDGLWHCWIVTWDGTTQVTYRDGVSVNSVARAGALGSSLFLNVGNYAGSTGTACRGAFCHAAWWENRALDPATVKILARTA